MEFNIIEMWWSPPWYANILAMLSFVAFIMLVYFCGGCIDNFIRKHLKKKEPLPLEFRQLSRFSLILLAVSSVWTILVVLLVHHNIYRSFLRGYSDTPIHSPRYEWLFFTGFNSYMSYIMIGIFVPLLLYVLVNEFERRRLKKN